MVDRNGRENGAGRGGWRRWEGTRNGRNGIKKEEVPVDLVDGFYRLRGSFQAKVDAACGDTYAEGGHVDGGDGSRREEWWNGNGRAFG